ncbi:Electron transport complex protein RnfC [Caloramator mitchellensis]|uniref:Electron transport complex protein RnfC n=1 Tax=Caloramator mitchellensis TaxID=908809 RepID=A0A0R3K0V5_CALMK|nr:4Fe-4S dicluster domain-containing protein [Caloramator mitchellensis]KRQ86498.1 Electron transport complex protein RnfC [Caloramator mitchellensis]
MDLIEKIYNAGVVGAGGAGFPSHIKLNNRAEYLIINGVECEPLLGTDKFLMRNKAKEIVLAINEIAKNLGAREVFIATKESYNEEINSVTKEIKENGFRIKIHKMKSFYPAGDEQVLVKEVIGKTVPPGGIPINVNTVVSNVGTAYNIYEAINDKPVIRKFISILGEIKNPMILNVPIGTSILECINAAGGSTIKDYAIIIGGPMMGKIISHEEAKNRTITKTDGALIIISKNHVLYKRKSLGLDKIIKISKSACIQCSYCTDLCPRFLLGHVIRPHRIMRALTCFDEDNEIFNESLLCSECGVCENYACPMGLSPREVNVYIKSIVRAKGKKANQKLLEENSMRDFRLVPTEKLLIRLGLNKYKTQKLQSYMEISADKVTISLKQHIGSPAKPVVEVGQRVEEGQLIGDIEKNLLGAKIHASISGIVKHVGEQIVIESDNKEVIK